MGRGFGALGLALLVAALIMPSAQAAFPGGNGKIAYQDFVDGALDIYVVNADGTGRVNVTNSPESEQEPAWSPDGTKIAFVSGPYRDGAIEVVNPDGSGRQVLFSGAYTSAQWSPDGTKFVVQAAQSCVPEGDVCHSDLYTVNTDGTNRVQITSDYYEYSDARWAPDGRDIAALKWRTWCCGSITGVWLMAPDGSNARRISELGHPEWLPDAQRIAMSDDNGTIFTVRRDGSDRIDVAHDRPPGTFRRDPAWSPDGSKLTYLLRECPGYPEVVDCSLHVAVSNSDGSGEQIVATELGFLPQPDWQPLPVNSYARPKGATPTQVSLVPAFRQCTAPNREHGPPLSFGSCNPPAQSSGALTVGTPDANARPPKSRGSVRYDVLPGNPATPADEADVKITLELLDVYEQGSLADYAGELAVHAGLRITDKLNTPHPGGPGAATVSDTTLEATAQCTPTADTTEGASCSLVTTADAVVPGAVPEGRRAVWQLGQVEVLDAAGDVFLRQGLFVP